MDEAIWISIMENELGTFFFFNMTTEDGSVTPRLSGRVNMNVSKDE